MLIVVLEHKVRFLALGHSMRYLLSVEGVPGTSQRFHEFRLSHPAILVRVVLAERVLQKNVLGLAHRTGLVNFGDQFFFEPKLRNHFLMAYQLFMFNNYKIIVRKMKSRFEGHRDCASDVHVAF